MGTLPRCECWVFYSVTKPGKQPFLLVAIKSYFFKLFYFNAQIFTDAKSPVLSGVWVFLIF